MLAIRNFFYLALPIMILTTAYLQKWIVWPNFKTPIPLFIKLRQRVPFLQTSASEFLIYMALLAVIIFIFSLKYEKIKKPITLFVFTLLMHFYFSYFFLLLCIGAYALIYAGLKVSIKKSSIGLSLITLGLVYLYFICLYANKNTWFTFVLFAQVLFSTYSIYRDIHGKIAVLNILDCWILMFTFPGGLFSIFYGYKDFKNTFLNTDYTLIARSGVVQLLKGLFLVYLTYIIESAFFPVISTSTYHITSILDITGGNTAIAWYYGFVLLILFVLEQVATLHILQGVTRILGYNVKQQVNNLFASKSFLDFWKRDSYNSRIFMMNYFFMPVFLRTKNIFLSNASVWVMYSVMTAVAYGGINYDVIVPNGRSLIWITKFFKFGVVYFMLSYLEMKLLLYFTETGAFKTSKTKKTLYSVTMYLFLIIVLIVGHEFGGDLTLTNLKDIFKTIFLLLGIY